MIQVVEVEAEVAGMGDEVGICSTGESSGESDIVELGTFPQSFGLLIVDGTEFGCSLGSIRAGNVMVDVREGDVLVWNDGGRRGAEKTNKSHTYLLSK